MRINPQPALLNSHHRALVANALTCILSGTIALAVPSCALFSGSTISFPDSVLTAPAYLSEAQRLIVEGGATLVGKKKLEVNGVVYPNDCTGVVRAAYAFASMDLAFRFGSYEGNGVKRLFYTLNDAGLIYSVTLPAPGDLIFWDNTWDANGNGRIDDELTHVGVVISVEDDGDIRYLHYNYGKGPVIERMNLLKPGDEERDEEGLLNSPLRMRSAPKGIGSGSATLYRVFAQGYRLDFPGQPASATEPAKAAAPESDAAAPPFGL